jgi:hypothetical protein
MSMMTTKTMLAAGLVCLLLSGGLSMLSTNGVEDAVIEATKTTPLDNICSDDDCTEFEEDWVTSTTDRDFYGWTVTNPAEVANGSAPTHKKIGPVTYTITSDRTFTSHNSTAGTLTYHENTSYACSVDTNTSCDVQITQLNIAFVPQTIGATGLAINGIMDLTKVGFSSRNRNSSHYRYHNWSCWRCRICHRLLCRMVRCRQCSRRPERSRSQHSNGNTASSR